MRDGSEAAFGAGYNVLPIWKDRMDSRTWVPTPNADVVYSMSYLDLKETGPLVVAAPPNVIGMFTDFFQRTITDVGAIGPPDPPAALFWAVTAYNVTDGTMPETPQLLPSINGFNELAANSDGSIDLWFGPEKPADAPESNWIQTVAGRNFLVALRLYGTGVEFFDQTWKPDDVVKVN
jgi:hypothetical protein